MGIDYPTHMTQLHFRNVPGKAGWRDSRYLRGTPNAHRGKSRWFAPPLALSLRHVFGYRLPEFSDSSKKEIRVYYTQVWC